MTDPAEIQAFVNAGLEVVRLGKDNNNLRKSGDNLAFALSAVTGLIKTVATPLYYFNSSVEEYFSTKFAADLSVRLASIPGEELIAPNLALSNPTISGLANSSDDPPLRELYLNLLATGMDQRSASAAHPAFAKIISDLSSAEVGILNSVLLVPQTPIAELRVESIGQEGWNLAYRHLLNLRAGEATLLDERTPAFVDNWVRLGLVSVNYTEYMTGPDVYSWVFTRPEYSAQAGRLSENQTMADFAKGILHRTDFGLSFAVAVGIL